MTPTPREELLGLDSKGHVVKNFWSPRPAISPMSTTPPFLLANRATALPGDFARGSVGVEIEDVAGPPGPAAGKGPRWMRSRVSTWHWPLDLRTGPPARGARLDSAAGSPSPSCGRSSSAEERHLVEVKPPLVRTPPTTRSCGAGCRSRSSCNADFSPARHAEFEDRDGPPRPAELKAGSRLNYGRSKLDGRGRHHRYGAGLVIVDAGLVAYAGEKARRVKAGQLLDRGGASSELCPPFRRQVIPG